jgi:hypothetical protein
VTLRPAQPDPTAVKVMKILADAGVRIAPDGPNVRYWSPTPLTPELRELIANNKPALLAYLAIWSQKRATALGHEADVLVEKLDVPGTDPDIQGAADRYVTALESEPMAGVRLAVFQMEMRARFLAAQRQACAQDANAHPGAEITHDKDVNAPRRAGRPRRSKRRMCRPGGLCDLPAEVLDPVPLPEGEERADRGHPEHQARR